MRLTVDFLPRPRSVGVVVVFDVLRMTSHACAMFDRGLASLEVIASEGVARERAAATGALLFGERGGLPPTGFDGGNSPQQTLSLDLRGRRAILCTSNGSRAVEAAVEAEGLLLGGVVNASAVARALLARHAEVVTLSCAGTQGEVSLEDVVGAACVLRALQRLGVALEVDDGARLALRCAAAGDPARTLREATHARTLEGLGFGDDVAWAATPDLLAWVPQRTALAPARFDAWAFPGS